MSVHGHSDVLNVLTEYLPPVSVFVGPYSVGRWTSAEHIRRQHGIDSEDTLRVRELTVDAVQAIVEFVLTKPAKSPHKMVIVELYKASRGAQVALTSVLENPGTAKIIVIAQPSDLLPGVRSRGQVFFFRLLSTAQVAAILVDEMNFGAERAQALAARSGGQVAGALRVANSEEVVTVVRKALSALRLRDADALLDLANEWSDEATVFLAQWCNETLSQQWTVFDHEDYVAGRALPLRILMALRSRVRPRLVVRSLLMEVLRG